VKLRYIGAAIIVAVSLGTPSAFGCGFVADVTARRTWRQEFAEAKFVVVGMTSNARKRADGRPVLDLTITSWIKSHPAFADKKTIEILHAVEDKAQVVVFFDIYKGEPDPFLALPGASPKSIAFFKELLAIDGKDHAGVLRYCLGFLDDADRAVADEAFLEFMKTPDKELGEAARTLRADKVRALLQKPNLTSDQLRMFGFLLGNCGDESDARLLRSLLETEAKAKDPRRFDGLLTGYVLLQPKEGWAYVGQLLGDKEARWVVRFSALGAARFFWNTRPDVIGQDQVYGAFRAALADPELADFPIGYLRQRKCWDLTDEVLALYGAKSFEPKIIQNEILRYALQCPRPAAAQLVARVRAEDPERVADMEDSLRELERR
jgi:hypothetical protein